MKIYYRNDTSTEPPPIFPSTYHPSEVAKLNKQRQQRREERDAFLAAKAVLTAVKSVFCKHLHQQIIDPHSVISPRWQLHSILVRCLPEQDVPITLCISGYIEKLPELPDILLRKIQSLTFHFLLKTFVVIGENTFKHLTSVCFTDCFPKNLSATIKNMPSLQKFSSNGPCYVKDLVISGHSSLQEVEVRNITTEALIVMENEKLKSLNVTIQRKRIRKIYISNCLNLNDSNIDTHTLVEELTIINAGIPTLTVSKHTELKLLNLTGLPSLTTLHLSSVKKPALSKISVKKPVISKINDLTLANLQKLKTLSTKNITCLPKNLQKYTKTLVTTKKLLADLKKFFSNLTLIGKRNAVEIQKQALDDPDLRLAISALPPLEDWISPKIITNEYGECLSFGFNGPPLEALF